MLRFEQLDFFTPPVTSASSLRGRDAKLEAKAKELLRSVSADKLVPLVRVEWNGRLRSAAGRAVYQRTLVSLNPRLHEHGEAEIDRTLRHELAHLVAQLRAGRRRIPPHGQQWREACRDLGIADEQRCHTLPFPTRARTRRFLYRCPNCKTDFPRVRRIRRAVACLACCRKHNRGDFDERFKLRLVNRPS
jgi:predicted SprT family Zn-dependent metalloprotease